MNKGLLCLLLALASAQVPYPPSAVDELELLSAEALEVGQRAVVHVELTSGITNATTVAKFYPLVDSFSTLTVAGSRMEFAGSHASVRLSLWYNSTNVSSTSSVSLGSDDSQRAPYLAAWIGVRRGIVEGIAWDRNCGGARVAGLSVDQCSGPRCVDGFCRAPCASNSSSACDLRIYLAWKGRDASRRALQSAGNLPNNFNIFSSGSVFDEIAGTSSDFVYGLLNAFDTSTASSTLVSGGALLAATLAVVLI